MGEIIKKRIPLKLNTERLYNLLELKDDYDKSRLKNLSIKVENLLNAKAIYKESFIKEIEKNKVVIDDTSFRSSILAINLQGLKQVFPFIITVGEEVENLHQSIDSILE
ncbi:MAG: hypothetical protein ACOCRO_02090, partial [Halanaerobiales bacterium]